MGVVEKEKMKYLSKEEQLEKWIPKAVYYSKKERNTKTTPKPGEIWTVDLGINVGSVMNGVRPFLVLTSTIYNDKSGTISGIPCSNKEYAKKGQILITNEILQEGNVTGVIKLEMITTVSKGQIGDYIGKLNNKGINLVGKFMENYFVPLKRRRVKKA